MKKPNSDIRKQIVINDLKYWEVSQAIGIHDSNFSRMLRVELAKEKKSEIFSVIEKLVKEKELESCQECEQ